MKVTDGHFISAMNNYPISEWGRVCVLDGLKIERKSEATIHPPARQKTSL